MSTLEEYGAADIIIAAQPGPFVDKLARGLPPERIIWIHPDSAHHLAGGDVDSVGVLVISEADCGETTLEVLLEASVVRGWRVIVLGDGTQAPRRQRWLDLGASAVLPDRLAPGLIATMVREALRGNLPPSANHAQFRI